MRNLNQDRRRADRAGVTLIELMVVVAIIGLFVALVGPAIFKQLGKGQTQAAKSQIEGFMTALGTYKLDVGTFPTTDQGLQALRVKPGDVANWNGPYLPKDVPQDPWHHAYIYKYPGEHGDEPDIVCLGGDGQPGGEGDNADIVSWK